MNLTRLTAWWSQRALREKLLIGGGLCAALIAVADALVAAPLERRLKHARAELSSLQSKADARPRHAPVDQAAAREQEARLHERMQAALASNQDLHRRIAEAARLPETLRAIVGTVGAVRVLELDLAGDGDSGSTAGGKLHRLPITLKVAGNWTELHQLMQQVERHADALQWTQLALDGNDWPEIQLTLKAHVWSLSPRWGAPS